MPFIALVSMASMVGLLRFRPAPVANLVARMPSGFAEAAREEAKPSRARVFEHGIQKALEKFLRPLRPQGPSTSLRKSKERFRGVPLPRRPGSALKA